MWKDVWIVHVNFKPLNFTFTIMSDFHYQFIERFHNNGKIDHRKLSNSPLFILNFYLVTKNKKKFWNGYVIHRSPWNCINL